MEEDALRLRNGDATSMSSTPVPIVHVTAPEAEATDEGKMWAEEHRVCGELVHALGSMHNRESEAVERTNISEQEDSLVEPELRGESPRAQTSAAEPCSSLLPAVVDDCAHGTLGGSSMRAFEHNTCAPSMRNALLEDHEPQLSVDNLCVESAGTCLTVLVTSCRRAWWWLTRRRRQRGIVGNRRIRGDLQRQRCADGCAEIDGWRPVVSAELKWTEYLNELGSVPAIAASSDTTDAVHSRKITARKILCSPTGLQKVIAPALVPVEPKVSLRWLHLLDMYACCTSGRKQSRIQEVELT